jgi:hypothetical protein
MSGERIEAINAQVEISRVSCSSVDLEPCSSIIRERRFQAMMVEPGGVDKNMD